MHYRELGRTGRLVSEIGFGAWAIGGGWGHVSDEDAVAALHAAIDAGVTFIDTADVYGDGRSERLVGSVARERSEDLVIATKAGRRLDPHTADGYNRENLSAYVERSLQNLGTDAIDLLQLHCPPTDVYYRPEVFGVLDELVALGKIRAYGVSVERVEEALKAIEFPNVQSVQIIYNIFRQRPADRFLDRAFEQRVAVLARVPLASGLLTGKMTADTSFAADDHRTFNRNGEAFDKGETFAGLDYQVGLDAVEALRPLVPDGFTMAQFALKWVLAHRGVSATIPGAKNPSQAKDNAATSALPDLDEDVMRQIAVIYDRYARDLVHQRW